MGYYERIGEKRYLAIKDFYELMVDGKITATEFQTAVGQVIEGEI